MRIMRTAVIITQNCGIFAWKKCRKKRVVFLWSHFIPRESNEKRLGFFNRSRTQKRYSTSTYDCYYRVIVRHPEKLIDTIEIGKILLSFFVSSSCIICFGFSHCFHCCNPVALRSIIRYFHTRNRQALLRKSNSKL